MKTYNMFDGDEYVGQITCESVTIEHNARYNRYIFVQKGYYSTILRTVNNLRFEEDKI